MPAPDPLLVDTDDVAAIAAKLGVATNNVDLVSALTRASNRFRGAVHHPVHVVTDDEEEHDGTPRSSLALDAFPVIGTPTVTIDGATVTDFSVTRKSGRLRRRVGWGDEFQTVIVTYSHGFAKIPAGIRAAVLDQAEAIFNTDAGLSQMGAAGEQATFGTAHTVGVTAQWSEAVSAHQRSTAGGA